MWDNFNDMKAKTKGFVNKQGRGCPLALSSSYKQDVVSADVGDLVLQED